MKTLTKLLIAACLMLFAIQPGIAQVVPHYIKHHTKRRVYRHRVYESRAAMQLRQGELHERQAAEVERVERKLKHDTTGHR